MNEKDLTLVERYAKQVGIDPQKARELIEKIADELQPKEERPPAQKKQYVILVSDPQGLFPKSDFSGWVFQILEEESPVTICERIFNAAYEFNASKRGRLMPVQTVGEAVENIKASYFKEQEVWVKTKTPVLIVVTNNEIPRVEKLCSGASKDNAAE